jgi:hypothetical protein
MSDEISVWKVLSTIGQGIGKTVEVIGQGIGTTVQGVQSANAAVRDSVPITEITSVFNTTDKTIKFLNKETARDAREILGQTAVSLKTEQTAGAWIPWYEPPRFDGFSARHVEILVDDVAVLYIWQKGDFVYWSNRLDSEGRPAKAYKMAGVTYVGGQRTLVVRNDPETGYSAFLSNTVSGL